MIRIVVDDAGQLSQKEATALGHMFMHLAGHSMHVAPEPQGAVQHEVGRGRMSEHEFHKQWGPQTIEKDNSGMSSRCNDFMKSTLPVLPNESNEVLAERLKAMIPPPSKPVDWESAANDIIEEELILVGPETVAIPAPPASIPAPPSQTDSKGIKWDARIHAKNKAVTASGVWKLGRNLSPDFVKQVMKELKGCPAPIAPALLPPVPAPIAPIAPALLPPVPVTLPLPPVAGTFIAPPPPPPFPNVTPAVSLPGMDPIQAIMAKETGLTASGRVTTQGIINVISSIKDASGNAYCRHLGEVSQRPDLVPTFIAELDKAFP